MVSLKYVNVINKFYNICLNFKFKPQFTFTANLEFWSLLYQTNYMWIEIKNLSILYVIYREKNNNCLNIFVKMVGWREIHMGN